VRSEPGERVIYRAHPSWRSMIGFHVKGLVAAVLAGVIAGFATRTAAGHIQAGWVAVGVLAVFVLVLLLGLARRAATTYTVTDRRLIITRGVLGRDVREARLERVQNLACAQTLRERMLRVGSVHFDTAAGADFDFWFEGVERPRELVRTVDDALREPARLSSSVSP
jgi:uncharacterized membrane protein YdbT with pleckstrin-like domain